MDVTVPEIPVRYDDYRDALRRFIADHKPTLGWKRRSGLRVDIDVAILRRYWYFAG